MKSFCICHFHWNTFRSRIKWNCLDTNTYYYVWHFYFQFNSISLCIFHFDLQFSVGEATHWSIYPFIVHVFFFLNGIFNWCSLSQFKLIVDIFGKMKLTQLPTKAYYATININGIYECTSIFYSPKIIAVAFFPSLSLSFLFFVLSFVCLLFYLYVQQKCTHMWFIGIFNIIIIKWWHGIALLKVKKVNFAHTADKKE